MLEKAPSHEEMQALLGEYLYQLWQGLLTRLDRLYNMECLWDRGGKAWTYAYKYRRGGKTLCALYARENCFGFMIIFGKTEREKFEADRASYSKAVQQVYDTAATYHDGKWMMFELTDTSLFQDLERLLTIKRRPNKK